MAPTYIEIHNNTGATDPWYIRWIAENTRGRGNIGEDSPTPYAYYKYLDGVRVPTLGSADLLSGFFGSPEDLITRSSALNPLTASGTHTFALGECAGHWVAPKNTFPRDFVVDSEEITNAVSFEVGYPDAPVTPTPADGSTIATWNDTLLWTGDKRIDGPYYYQFPFWTIKLDEYYVDSPHTVFFHQTLGSLTNIRRAYSWEDDEYEMREVNPQYFNFSDYLWLSPYPPDTITLYWQIKTTNEWGTIWGPVWSFTFDNTYIPPSPPPPDVPPFPPPKPPPDPDPWWDPPDPPVPPTPPGPLPPYWATGGGGHQKNLVVSGNNKVYYEPHTANTVPYTP